MMNSQPTVEPPPAHPAIAPEVTVNPLWLIATAMAGFFAVAGLVIAFG